MDVLVLEVTRFGDRHDTIKTNVASVSGIRLHEVTAHENEREGKIVSLYSANASESATILTLDSNSVITAYNTAFQFTPWCFDNVDVFIAHNTDVVRFFPNLTTELKQLSSGSKSGKQMRILILHTMDWNDYKVPRDRKQVETTGLLTIVRCGSDLVQRNIAAFLRKSNKKSVWDVEALLGFDPRFEATLELLQLLLPLDVELQLEDDSAEGIAACKGVAQELIDQSEAMDNLLSKVTRDSAALELLRTLKNHASTVARAQDRAALHDILGFQYTGRDLKRKDDGTPDLLEDGFHRVYHKLRDTVFELLDQER